MKDTIATLAAAFGSIISGATIAAHRTLQHALRQSHLLYVRLALVTSRSRREGGASECSRENAVHSTWGGE